MSASSLSSSLLPLHTNSPTDKLPLTAIVFPFNLKPIKVPKLRTLFPNSPPASFPSPCILSCASAAFDGVELTQENPPEEQVEEGEVEDEDDDEAVESQSADAGRLYVGNLPYSMTNSQLSEIFAEAGGVVAVEIVYDRVTGRSRGFAFVTMESVEEAKEAIRLFDGAQVGGRSVKVNFPEVPKGGEREVMAQRLRSNYQGFIDSPHKVYVGNLSWGLTSQGLREAFADQPGFLSAKVIYDRDSGRSRGFGFITFASAEEMESALNAMNEMEVEGRPLRLNVAEQRAPVSPAAAAETSSGNESTEVFSNVSS